MLKLVIVVLVVLAVAAAQVLLVPGAVSSQGTIQAHSPFSVSSSSRTQVHGPPLLGLAPLVYY